MPQAAYGRTMYQVVRTPSVLITYNEFNFLLSVRLIHVQNPTAFRLIMLTSYCSALLSSPSLAARRLSKADECAVSLTRPCLALLRLSSVPDISSATYSCCYDYIVTCFGVQTQRRRTTNPRTTARIAQQVFVFIKKAARNHS